MNRQPGDPCTIRIIKCKDCEKFYQKDSPCVMDIDVRARNLACMDFVEVEHYDDLEQEEFTQTAWEIARDVVLIVCSKNLKYRGAYRVLRNICRDNYGDQTIPYFMHRAEKQLRQGALMIEVPNRKNMDFDNDDEDSQLDSLGYELLEAICRKLDDNRPDDR
jgi:hypothetical protein